MEVSASSEFELGLSSTRRNGASAPVFVFSSMHKTLQNNPVSVSDGGTLDVFYSIFSRYTVLLSAERHNMGGIVHGIFMHVHKKELYGSRTDESAADKKNNNQTNPLRHHGTLKQEYKITANHILQI